MCRALLSRPCVLAFFFFVYLHFFFYWLVLGSADLRLQYISTTKLSTRSRLTVPKQTIDSFTQVKKQNVAATIQVAWGARTHTQYSSTHTHLPHGIGVLSGLDARGVDGTVGLVPHVEHHDRPVVAADRQERVVHRVKVEAHDLFPRARSNNARRIVAHQQRAEKMAGGGGVQGFTGHDSPSALFLYSRVAGHTARTYSTTVAARVRKACRTCMLYFFVACILFGVFTPRLLRTLPPRKKSGCVSGKLGRGRKEKLPDGCACAFTLSFLRRRDQNQESTRGADERHTRTKVKIYIAASSA